LGLLLLLLRQCLCMQLVHQLLLLLLSQAPDPRQVLQGQAGASAARATVRYTYIIEAAQGLNPFL
jgi:hypothetical protein